MVSGCASSNTPWTGSPMQNPAIAWSPTGWTPTEAPALELAALYHQRWTIESSLDELKTHLADRQVLLRSKRPELVEQEFYALLLVHAAVRHLMTEAAPKPGRPLRICLSRMPFAYYIAGYPPLALFPLGVGQHGYTAS